MKKIYPIQWLVYHPYETSDATDRYYCNLVNKLLKTIGKYDIMAGTLLEDEDIEHLYENAAFFLTGWFEDIISQTGIWQIFTSECKKRYGSRLPFYELDNNYYPDEINLEDVKFILWHCFQYGNKRNTIYNPENTGISKLAEALYAILDKEYETAPENERLQDFFDFSNLTEDNFLQYRDYIQWFYMNSYINIGCYDDYEESKAELLEELLENPKIDANTTDIMLYSHEVRTVLLSRTPLLGITAPEYIRLLQASKKADPDAPYMNIDSVEEDFYLIESKDDEYVTVKTLEGNTTYKIANDSLDTNLETFIPGDTVVSSTLFKYGKKWRHNGIMMNYRLSKNPGILETLEDKNLSLQQAQTAYNDFIKASKGKHLVFLKNKKALQQFLTKKIQYENAPNVHLPIGNNDNIMLTASPTGGLCFITSLNDCVASPDNPFYDQEAAEQKAIKLLVDPNFIPYEISCYLIDKGYLKDAGLNSTLGPEHGRALVQKNAQFMLDYFFKRCRDKDYTPLGW